MLQVGKGIGVGGIAIDYSQPTPKITYQYTYNIGYGQLVYNGELEGITKALEYASQVAGTGLDVRIFADNQAALYRLQTPSCNPGQQWQLRALQASQIAKKKGNKISINWVPGHTDIFGNEKADALAKLAAIATPQDNQTSLALIRIKIKLIVKNEWLERLNKYKKEA